MYLGFLYWKKNIKLDYNIKNQFVLIDFEPIERVFVNILTNTIKYTTNNGNLSLKSCKFNNESGLKTKT